MLELKRIRKIYETESLKQVALDDVSINFRKNEFAAILGPSGSGKTTLLNIIGGLDHYDSGELEINEVSTKKYKDSDWDSYRNHRVGFVFQSYNLITHQSILSNVELALTLSGISKKERVERAKKALEDVGLLEHMNKKPNQLSGGQMQRVAIARALVNDPNILLADEPTGALDSQTSIQIMNLLKEVSKDRLVIMVTHNPEIAKEYANRIIELKDGKIINDTNPYDGETDTKEDLEIEKKKSSKTSMSLFTALSLSLNNLMTKKGRTILTAFAGSIGIIGIALILSLSNGVQEYINRTEVETLSSFPLSIESTTMDLSSMMMEDSFADLDTKCKNNSVCTIDDLSINPAIVFTSSVYKNNLKDFKKAIDNNYKNINDYVTDIQYIYDLDLQIYSKKDEKITQVSPSNSMMMNEDMMNQNMMNNSALISSYTSIFTELIDNKELLDSQYEIVAGKMPKEFNELVLVVNENNQLPLSLIYSLNFEDKNKMYEIFQNLKEDKNTEVENFDFNYDDIVGTKYKLVLNTDYYKKVNDVYVNSGYDLEYLKSIVNNGIDLEIVGIIKISDDAVEARSGFVGYTHKLTEYVIEKINESEIAKIQKENPDINIFTNQEFDNITSSYENNLKKLGIFDIDNPSMINIYPSDYNNKEIISDIIEEYNENKSEGEKLIYTDYVGILMSGISTIINVITYILIAFVAISLVVSSIMIAIITYISVLERTKEIGILRAIGASKKDIRRVFNAETLIEGLASGVFGIVVTIVLLIPINMIIKNVLDVSNIAILPLYGAIGLIIISVVLTVVAGLVPSKMASKKDPVEALRTE